MGKEKEKEIKTVEKKDYIYLYTLNSILHGERGGRITEDSLYALSFNQTHVTSENRRNNTIRETILGFY